MLAIALHATAVDSVKAKIVAKNFLIKNAGLKSENITLNLIYRYSTNEGISKPKSVTNFYYIFEINNSGFIMVAADERITPILAYSLLNKFKCTNIPKEVISILDNYNEEIGFVITNNIAQDQKTADQWANLANYIENEKSSMSAPFAKKIDPLINTMWDQAPLYQTLCPLDNVNVQTYAGCVSIAMGQIMKYWNYPSSGEGLHSYKYYSKQLTCYFYKQKYFWDSMPNMLYNTSSNFQKYQITKLISDLGISVDMNYGSNASSAIVSENVGENQGKSSAEFALKNYFGYKKTLYTLFRDDATWVSLLKTELNAARPILLCGGTGNDAHAYVCDGYDQSDYFHMNFGWGGYYNGYYSINRISVNSVFSLTSNQYAVIGIEPANNERFSLELSSKTLSNDTISYGDAFSLKVNLKNNSSKDFNGALRVVAFDSVKCNLIELIGLKEELFLEKGKSFANELTFQCNKNYNLYDGTYILHLQYLADGNENWMTVDETVNLKNMTRIFVKKPPLGIELFNDILYIYEPKRIGYPIDRLPQGDTIFSTYTYLINKSNQLFKGDIRVKLMSESDTSLHQVLMNCKENIGIKPDSVRMISYKSNCTYYPAILPQGAYKLVLDFKNEQENEWHMLYSKLYNYYPYGFYIIGPPLPDRYEPNNTYKEAYNIPLNFKNNKVNFISKNANFHSKDSDRFDYFKIILENGYDYYFNLKLTDKMNYDYNVPYSADAIYKYSKDGKTYYGSYTDSVPGVIFIKNSDTVYFQLSEKFGDTGTYKFLLHVERDSIHKPDRFEDNNSFLEASKITYNLIADTSLIKLDKLNFHTRLDKDYFRLDLDSGYKYEIRSYLFDNHNSALSDSLFASAKFLYADENQNLSNFHEDSIINFVSATSKKALYFVIQKNKLDYGDYNFTLKIKRSAFPVSNVNKIISSGILIYPNPADKLLNINLYENTNICNITIFDLQGQELITQNSSQNYININHLKNGIYSIKIVTIDCTYYQKFVIMR